MARYHNDFGTGWSIGRNGLNRDDSATMNNPWLAQAFDLPVIQREAMCSIPVFGKRKTKIPDSTVISGSGETEWMHRLSPKAERINSLIILECYFWIWIVALYKLLSVAKCLPIARGLTLLSSGHRQGLYTIFPSQVTPIWLWPVGWHNYTMPYLFCHYL